MADLDTSHQGNAHNIATVTAIAARQVAYKAASNQAAVKQADIAYHRAIISSARAQPNNVGFSVNVQALIELGTGGT